MATYNKRNVKANANLTLICIKNHIDVFKVLPNGTAEGFIFEKTYNYSITIGKKYNVNTNKNMYGILNRIDSNKMDDYYFTYSDMNELIACPKDLFGDIKDLRDIKLEKLLDV